MWTPIAGFIMATKIHFNQMKYPVMKRTDNGVAECLYENEVKKLEVKEKYEKSVMPESGYMTVEDYEAKSRAVAKKDIKIPAAEMPKDSNMVYVPQTTYKLVKYNNPVGSPELRLPRKLNFDRQINAQGIISGDKTMLVYPAVYYYAQTDCTSCDLFLIQLDTSLNDIEKVMQANIIRREEQPLISTDKDISVKYLFRTLTPIDFSSDNTKLIVKEKTGYRHDGIWKTDLWIYDFKTKSAKKLPQIRDAVINYWAECKQVNIEENRWDIFPLGFDANNDNRVFVSAYAYTGDKPKFLGTWSIDVDGNASKLESLEETNFPISVNGFRLEADSVKDISEVEFDAKQAKKLDKANKKYIKAEKKFENKFKKVECKRTLHQMDVDTLIKINNRKLLQQELKKNKNNNTNSPTE